ncbi:hypothetical protein [Zooshikella harenae]|uniref:MotA/TolQ/ExbB proton channel domain-containing protein n=1 Tax=Zooshikella harenae TaxID=2827238 RepID=A0ABS5ZBI7_9GAMM|nr:hypothetical protein [Zooshikella harenae]MBU2711426.1 hypothetical protein [Zooshikella harenae]
MDAHIEFSWLTAILIGLIILLAVYFHIAAFQPRTVNHAPTLLTSIGIFGTFLGIALGLKNFDTTDIQASVPMLIEGLKTAFWSSIAGLSAALTIKARFVLSKPSRAETTHYQTQLELLGEVRDAIQQQGNNQQQAVVGMHDDLKQAIVQLQCIYEQHQQALTAKQTQALQSSLRELLIEFNEKIEVQYGENFQALNKAVGGMLEWQQVTRHQLDEFMAQQQVSLQIMTEATAAHERVVKQTSIFTQVSGALEQLLGGLEKQAKGLEDYLQLLGTIVNSASSGLPKLEERIISLTSGLADTLTMNQQQMKQLMTETANDLVMDHRNLSTQLQRYQQVLDKQGESLVGLTEKHWQQLDSVLTSQLNKSLETFGYQLTALSEKFVSDYAPLTEKLRKIITIAEAMDA